MSSHRSYKGAAQNLVLHQVSRGAMLHEWIEQEMPEIRFILRLFRFNSRRRLAQHACNSCLKSLLN